MFVENTMRFVSIGQSMLKANDQYILLEMVSANDLCSSSLNQYMWIVVVQQILLPMLNSLKKNGSTNVIPSPSAEVAVVVIGTVLLLLLLVLLRPAVPLDRIDAVVVVVFFPCDFGCDLSFGGFFPPEDDGVCAVTGWVVVALDTVELGICSLAAVATAGCRPHNFSRKSRGIIDSLIVDTLVTHKAEYRTMFKLQTVTAGN
ncbi:hypothetical protein BLOT_009438 [Blomia tropicalis]|nr:hypothetical protein BLOT_009438 [Blomia tropicalis]